jgi:hypothetical protein
VTASRAAVIYGLDADASLVARAADRALEGCGCFTMVDKGEVWIWRRDQPVNGAVQFLPGQQLVVEGGTWRIEDQAVTT